MAIESTGHSRGNPRIYELIENAPKTGTGKSPVIWAWPEIIDWLRIAGQPVPGPWPPHQEPRPNPEEESLPVAVAERPRPTSARPPQGNVSKPQGNVGKPQGNVGRMDQPVAPPPPPRRSGTPRPGRGLMDD